MTSKYLLQLRERENTSSAVWNPQVIRMMKSPVSSWRQITCFSFASGNYISITGTVPRKSSLASLLPTLNLIIWNDVICHKTHYIIITCKKLYACFYISNCFPFCDGPVCKYNFFFWIFMFKLRQNIFFFFPEGQRKLFIRVSRKWLLIILKLRSYLQITLKLWIVVVTWSPGIH